MTQSLRTQNVGVKYHVAPKSSRIRNRKEKASRPRRPDARKTASCAYESARKTPRPEGTSQSPSCGSRGQSATRACVYRAEKRRGGRPGHSNRTPNSFHRYEAPSSFFRHATDAVTTKLPLPEPFVKTARLLREDHAEKPRAGIAEQRVARGEGRAAHEEKDVVVGNQGQNDENE